MIRGWEWIILLIAVILIFGPAKIPELARSVGKAISEFRKGIKGEQEDVKESPKNAETDEEVKKSDTV
jgi:sec-independent protein translocase protein TatA